MPALPNTSAIAIIGMAGRFPEAPTLDAFWNNLANGKESLAEFSDEEMLASGVDPALLKHPNYVKKGTVLEDADSFDASFFGFNPREAQVIDPQQRVFLECAWQALEDAGYAGNTSERSIGVFAGASINSYVFNNILPNREVLEAVGPYQLMLATDKDYLATRAAYKLDLHGPAMTVQTACSTSLVAVQVACQSLLGGQCELALAGGVSVSYPSKSGYLYTEGMIFSPDGHCRPFDARGGGIRGGAGVGIVVLKRLEDAIRDGDNIRAVIRGAAVNNDGCEKIGYTAPSIDGQAQVIQAAQAMAGCDPDSISYIEAHGTATALGDPIEIAALERVFRSRTSRNHFCAIGSVKSNIGHLDAAAGIAGLIKTTLALENRQIPASLHYREPNPQINFAESPFFVNDRLRPWESESGPRRAGVSSFGIGGTNAHVVLEEAPGRKPSRKLRSLQLLPLSAKSPSALQTSMAQLETFLVDNPNVDLADAAYTLQIGRRRMPHRHFVMCETREEAIASLAKARLSAAELPAEEALSRPVAFLFSGQGSQHVRMAERLYRTESAFRKHLDECAELLIPHLGCDLRKALYPSDEPSPEAAGTSRLNETWLTQPALFAIEYSLAQMWMSWGIAPAAYLGHSIGEYVAACLAGVFSLSDALKVVSARGRLMQALPRGTMLAVALPVDQVSNLLNSDTCIAAVNTVTSCTVSGQDAAVAKLEQDLLARGVRCTKIPTSHAFHSAMMDSALDAFTQVVRSVALTPPTTPFVSNLTGTWIRPEEAVNPTYWALHLRNTVRFADGLQRLIEDPRRILLEVGPGQVLTSFAREVAGKSANVEILSSLPHRHDPQTADRFAMETLGRLWACGAAVDWHGLHAGEVLNRASLPGYPFERKRYYVEPKRLSSEGTRPDSGQAEQSGAQEKNPDISEWFYVPTWQRSARLSLGRDSMPVDKGLWLLFMDKGGLGEEVKQLLSKNGAGYIAVHAGARFERHSAGSYSIVPGNRDHYSFLLNELDRTRSLPRFALHLWNVTGSVDHHPETDDRRDLTFYCLVYLAQAWSELQEPQSLRLIVCADRLFTVCSSDEAVQASKSLLAGPCKVIPQEHPEIACCCVDVGTSIDHRQVAQHLVQEATDWRSRGMAAYRGSWRWQQSYVPIRIDESTDLPLRQRGVYLITGGLGGIGLTFANYLARTVKARLVLAARSPLPPAEQWDDWLSTNEANHPTSIKIREVRALEALGAEVLVTAANVSKLDEMSAVFEEAQRRFGPIHGVIHAAGIAGGGLVQLKTREAADAVFAPKVEGTRVLDSLVLRYGTPDFLVLCSSINALAGGVGTVDYCSANAFQDAYAESRIASNGCRILSINWDTWQEVGMAVNTEVPRDMAATRQNSLSTGIRPAEGVVAFERVLSTSLPQVGVITGDLRRLIQQANATNGLFARKSDNPAPPPSVEPLEITSNGSGGVSESATEAAIRGIWSELLGIQAAGLDDNFFALGGHSLLATEILSRIRSQFGAHLPVRTIFEAPTVRELAFVVDARLWRERASKPADAEDDTEREVIEL